MVQQEWWKSCHVTRNIMQICTAVDGSGITPRCINTLPRQNTIHDTHFSGRFYVAYAFRFYIYKYIESKSLFTK